MINEQRIIELTKSKIILDKIDHEKENHEKINIAKLSSIVASIILLFTTSVVFAINIIINYFPVSTKSIDKAITENKHIVLEDDFSYYNDIGIKINAIFYDGVNLDISYDIKREGMIKAIDIYEFEILDNKQNNIFSFDKNNSIVGLAHSCEKTKIINLENNIYRGSMLFQMENSNISKNIIIKIKSILIVGENDDSKIIPVEYEINSDIKYNMEKKVLEIQSSDDYIKEGILELYLTSAKLRIIFQNNYKTDWFYDKDVIYITDGKNIYYPHEIAFINDKEIEIVFNDIDNVKEKIDKLNIFINIDKEYSYLLK